MNPSVSVYYPVDRAPARRDLATGVVVALALLAGAFWIGEAAQQAFVPPAPARHDQAVPLPPPIPLLELQADEPAPAPDAAPAPDVARLADIPPAPTATPFPQPPEPIRSNLVVNPHLLVVPPVIGASGGDSVYNPDTLDQVPVATFQPAPNYPYSLKREGVSGTVLIDFIVEASGATSHVLVAGGRSDFGENAAAAVAKWRFHPGRKLGRAVRTHMVVPVRFTLESGQ